MRLIATLALYHSIKFEPFSLTAAHRTEHRVSGNQRIEMVFRTDVAGNARNWPAHFHRCLELVGWRRGCPLLIYLSNRVSKSKHNTILLLFPAMAISPCSTPPTSTPGPASMVQSSGSQLALDNCYNKAKLCGFVFYQILFVLIFSFLSRGWCQFQPNNNTEGPLLHPYHKVPEIEAKKEKSYSRNTFIKQCRLSSQIPQRPLHSRTPALCPHRDWHVCSYPI